MDWYQKALRGGGCAARVSGQCYGFAGRRNQDQWTKLPDGFPSAVNASGACCRRCHPTALRRAKAAAPAAAPRPAPKRDGLRPRGGPSPPKKRPSAPRRRQSELLTGGAYRTGPGRRSEPVNWDAARVTARPAAAVRPAVVRVPPLQIPPRQSSTSSRALVAAPDDDARAITSRAPTPDPLQLTKGQKIANITDVGELQNMVRDLTSTVKRLEGDKKRLAKQLADQEDYPAVKRELHVLRTASSRALAAGTDDMRAGASRRLRDAGLADFPALFDRAIVSGAIKVEPGTRRCMAVYLSDAATHANQPNSNLWRFSRENEQLWAAVSLMASGRSAVELLRGPQGQGLGSTAPRVDSSLAANLLGVPSPRKLRYTVLSINAEDDGSTGIFSHKIASVLALGLPSVFIKVDATDLNPELTEGKDFTCEGDVDISAFDPTSYDVSATTSRLKALCAPAAALLSATSTSDDGDGSAMTADTRHRRLEGSFIASARASLDFISELKDDLTARITELEALYAAKLESYSKSRQALDYASLHTQQWRQLMMITHQIKEAKDLLRDLTRYVAAAKVVVAPDACPAPDSSDEAVQAWLNRLVDVARDQISVVPRLSRLRRVAATHVYAVFLHSLDHSTFACVARFYSTQLSKDQYRLLYQKVKSVVLNVERGPEAPKPVVRGFVGDGEFSSFVDAEGDGVANLSQAAKVALVRHQAWLGAQIWDGDESRNVFGQGRHSGPWRSEQAKRLGKRWLELCYQRRRAPPRAPALLGFGPAKAARAQEVALQTWAAQRRRRGSSRSTEMYDFVLRAMKARGYATAAPVFRDVDGAAALPESERVLLDALLAFQPAPRPLPLAEIVRGRPLRLDDARKELSKIFPPSEEDVFNCAAMVEALRMVHTESRSERRTAIIDAMKATCLQAEMDMILTQHPGLLSRYYHPNLAADPSSFYHECFHHKLKTIVYGLMGQDDGDDVLISKQRLLNTACRDPHRINAEAVCRGSVDKHSDLHAQALVADEATKLRLLEDGHIRECLFLDVLGEFHEAFDMAGLDAIERAIRRYHFRFMAFALFGQKLFDTTSNINAEFKERTGLVANGILAALANADGLDALIDSLTPELRQVFVERALSNVPDLENYFSLLVGRIGYKPTVSVAESVLKSVDALSTLKSSTTRSFHMVQSKKKHYDSNDETKRSHKLWNTGLSMSKTSASYRSRAEDLVKRADAKAHPRLATVREQFK